VKTSLSSALLKEFLSYVGTPPVLLTAEDNHVRLNAWSNGIVFRAEYPATVKEGGEFTLSPSVVNILKNTHKDVYIDMETTDKGIKIKADTIKLNSPEASELILWPEEVSGVEYETTALPWMRVVANNRANKSIGMPIIEGMCFMDGTVIGLDGFRAASYHDANLVTNGESYVVPKEGMFFLSKVSPNDRVKFLFGKNRVTIQTPKITGTMAMLDGNFPIPNSTSIVLPNELMVGATELTAILRQAATIFKADNLPRAGMSTENGLLTVKATDGVVDFEGKTAVMVTGDELDLTLNTNYMLDYISHMDGDVFMEYGSNGDPARFHQKDNLQQLIMPLQWR
jgi:DNA polymerase III sliding clamp (beta) subunit (PCNA family)